LTSTAYAVIDGTDGRAHHIRLADLDAAGDSGPGSIVELRRYEDSKGRQRVALAIRSDLTIEAQVKAGGATWLDRQLLARGVSSLSDGGFGREVREAMDVRVDFLVSEGLGPPARAARHLDTRSPRHAAPARARRGQRKDLGGDRSALSFPRGGRDHRGRLPSARHPGLWPFCHDRQWARIQSRALDAVIGAAARPSGFWSGSVGGHDRLELAARYPSHPVTGNSPGYVTLPLQITRCGQLTFRSSCGGSCAAALPSSRWGVSLPLAPRGAASRARAELGEYAAARKKYVVTWLYSVKPRECEPDLLPFKAGNNRPASKRNCLQAILSKNGAGNLSGG
jgi:hypothetical protein